MKKVIFFISLFLNFSFFGEGLKAKENSDKEASVVLAFDDGDNQKAHEFLKQFLLEASKTAKICLNGDKICKKFADIIVKAFALKEMGQYILGPYFKKMDKDEGQVKEFEKLLTDYFIASYATIERVKLFASVDMENDDFLFKTTLNERKTRLTCQKKFKTEKSDVNVKIVLIKTKANTFDVFDILIEDIGLLISTRDALRDVYQKNENPKDFLKAFGKMVNKG